MASPEAERASEIDGPRELKLEGPSLIVAAALLLALLAGAFQLGRWTERASPAVAASELSGGEAPGPAGRTAEPSAPTQFDTVSEGREAEPEREVSRAGTSAPAAPSETASPADGPWTVQVFAGRDRQAADQILETLRSRGHPARLEASREGRTVLYRVRVGAYRDRAAAEAASERLRAEGMASPWVTSR